MSLHRLFSPPRCHIIIKDCLAIDNICNFKDHMYSLHRLLSPLRQRCNVIIKDCTAIIDICNFKDHMY